MAKHEDVSVEQREACIKRVGGWDNFLRFIGGHGRIVFDSIIEPIDVTSNGLSGEQWIERLERGGFRVGDHAKELLRSQSFVATNGIDYRLAVIRASEFDHDLSTDEVRSEAKKRGYITPPAEVATRLREILQDDELERLDLWWLAVMHEPFLDLGGDPRVFRIDRVDERRWLYACWAHPDDRWDRCGGFVFLLP